MHRLLKFALVASAANALPTCPAADSTSWRYKGRKKKDCLWVRARPGRCGKAGADGVIARDACPAACGVCCGDDPTWHWGTNPSNDCARLAGRKLRFEGDLKKGKVLKRCKKTGSHGVTGKQACCEACKEAPAVWTFNTKGKIKTCHSVERNPARRCGIVGEDGRAAHEACPEACADHQPAATTTTTSADEEEAVVGETSTTVAFEVAPEPSAKPSASPSAKPSPAPSSEPTPAPSAKPSASPSFDDQASPRPRGCPAPGKRDTAAT